MAMSELTPDGRAFVEGVVAKFADHYIAQERERCAKIAETWKSPLRPETEARRLGHEEAAREIAAAIRAAPT